MGGHLDAVPGGDLDRRLDLVRHHQTLRDAAAGRADPSGDGDLDPVRTGPNLPTGFLSDLVGAVIRGLQRGAVAAGYADDLRGSEDAWAWKLAAGDRLGHRQIGMFHL